MIRRAGHADTGAEVELPVRAEIQIESREDRLYLIPQRIEPRNGTDIAVVFDPKRDLFLGVEWSPLSQESMSRCLAQGRRSAADRFSRVRVFCKP